MIRVCRRRGVRLEERESRGRHEVGGVLRPAGKRTRRARGVDAARLESQRQTRAHEELRSRSAVESAVGEPVGIRAAEIEPRVPAEHVDGHATRVQRVHDETAAADQRLDVRRPDVLR